MRPHSIFISLKTKGEARHCATHIKQFLMLLIQNLNLKGCPLNVYTN
jgi:hypothetical protein